MNYTMKFSDGRTWSYRSLSAARTAFLRLYRGGAVERVSAEELRNGARALCWASKLDSHDDAGALATAVIRAKVRT